MQDAAHATDLVAGMHELATLCPTSKDSLTGNDCPSSKAAAMRACTADAALHSALWRVLT